MSAKKVSFDESHDEGASLEDGKVDGLSDFGKLLRNNGYTISVIKDSFLRNLEDTDVLVISYPKGEFKPEEITAITEFVSSGGGLLLTAEWCNIGGNAFTLNQLTKDFGVKFREDRVTDLVESYAEEIKIMGEVVGKKKIPQFLKIMRFAKHPIAEGIKEIVYVSGCSIDSPPENMLAVSSGSSFGDKDVDGVWDKGETVGSMAIASFSEYWNGRVVYIGDTSILTNKYITYADNKKFCLNMIKWLRKDI
ncbi:MAG: DUF4350 domain-containing protein [Thermoplasmata archaeon]